MIQLDKKSKFFLAVAIQLVIILLLLITKISIFSGGEEVLLKIAPVDPRDPLRGDYVTFRYDISDIGSFKNIAIHLLTNQKIGVARILNLDLL